MVYRGLDENTGKMVIIKKINIMNKKGGEKMKRKIESEIEIMKMLNNKHFIKFLGNNSLVEYDSEEEHKIKKEIMEIYMEDVCGKSLKNISNSLGGLNLNLVKKYGHEILRGLEYLHNNNIIHMDIKADNILVSNKGEVKIIDFGESVIPSLIGSMRKTFNIPFAGTESHMPPEIFIQMNQNIENIYREINKKNLGKSDIWSFGIVLVEVFVGEIKELEHKKNNSNISVVREMMSSNNLEHTCDEILFMCLNSILKKINIELTSREISNVITDIITDDAINDDMLYYIDFICCCLEKTIDERLSAKQLLEHYFVDSAKTKKFMSSKFISLGISL
jgi:serine/threonine protein kinase